MKLLKLKPSDRCRTCVNRYRYLLGECWPYLNEDSEHHGWCWSTTVGLIDERNVKQADQVVISAPRDDSESV